MSKYRYKEPILLFLVLTLWAGISRFTGSLCWFQSILGIPCPGCGTLRAIGSFLHGDWNAALQWHPLIFITLIIFPTLIMLWLFKRSFFFDPQGKILLGVVLGLYLGVYFYRMLTLFPHTNPMIPLPRALWRIAWNSLVYWGSLG